MAVGEGFRTLPSRLAPHQIDLSLQAVRGIAGFSHQLSGMTKQLLHAHWP